MDLLAALGVFGLIILACIPLYFALLVLDYYYYKKVERLDREEKARWQANLEEYERSQKQ